MRQALELRRQHHIHKDRGQQQRHDHVGRGLIQDLDLAGKPDLVPRRQAYALHQFLGVGGRLLQGMLRRNVGVDSDHELPIEAVDAARPEAAFQVRYRIEPYQAELGRGNQQPAERGRIVPLGG